MACICVTVYDMLCSKKESEQSIRFLQGGLLYVEIRKASGLISKPLYMLGRPALPDLM